MFKRRSPRQYVAIALTAVVVVYLAATCSTDDRVQACAPAAGSNAETLVNNARERAGFSLLYPCYLPNAQTLESTAVTGQPGRQLVSFVWRGPFEFTIRQAQFPPAVTPDPSGASRVSIDLTPNTPATLIERYDGSSATMYHLYWRREAIYYELQAFGPPQQRRIILEIARSLQ